MWLCLPLLAVPDEKSTGGTFASQYQASGERPANRDIAPAEKRQWNHGGGGGGGGGLEESYTCWERVDMDGVELGDMSLLDNDDWIECKVCQPQCSPSLSSDPRSCSAAPLLEARRLHRRPVQRSKPRPQGLPGVQEPPPVDAPKVLRRLDVVHQDGPALGPPPRSERGGTARLARRPPRKRGGGEPPRPRRGRGRPRRSPSSGTPCSNHRGAVHRRESVCGRRRDRVILASPKTLGPWRASPSVICESSLTSQPVCPTSHVRAARATAPSLPGRRTPEATRTGRRAARALSPVRRERAARRRRGL